MSDVAELTGRLVEIESINPDIVAGGSGEGGVARFVAEWCERAGLERKSRSRRLGVRTSWASRAAAQGGRSVMLNAHMDTVGVSGMAEPFVASARRRPARRPRPATT